MPTDLPDFQSNTILSVHYRCVSHTLNLIATTDVTNCIKSTRTLAARHDEAITRCEVLWKQLRSPKKREILTQYLGKALMKPIPVRWNSLFYSLEQIFSLSEKISEVNRHLEILNPLRDIDFQYIGEYLSCLRPVAETIDKLQGEINCSYGYLLPCLVSLRRKLMRISDSGNLVCCQPIAEGLLNSIERRFNDFFKVQGNGCFAAIAAVMHPKFKTQWIGYLDETAQSKVYKAVMHTARIEDTIVQPSSISNQIIQDGFFFILEMTEVIPFHHLQHLKIQMLKCKYENIYKSHVLTTYLQLMHIQLFRNYLLNIIHRYLLLLQLNVYFHM